MSAEAAPVPTASPTPASPKATKTAKVSKPKKAPKAPKSPRVKKAKTPSSHPTYGDMVRRAITELKDKKGSSRAGILKYILQHFKVGENVVQINAHLRQALKRGVTSGALKQVKGVGASGSFRLGDKAVKAKKPAAAAKPKSPKKKATGTVKKATSAAKPKSPKAKKPKTAKPKKTVAPKTAKAASPKKITSPKKAKVSKPKKAKAPATKKVTASKKKAAATKKAAPAAPISA